MKKSFRCLFVILLAVASFFTAIPCTSASERAFFWLNHFFCGMNQSRHINGDSCQ